MSIDRKILKHKDKAMLGRSRRTHNISFEMRTQWKIFYERCKISLFMILG